MTELATVAQAIDGTTLRAQALAMERPKRPPLRPQTVLSLVALAVAGAIVLVCVAAAAR